MPGRRGIVTAQQPQFLLPTDVGEVPHQRAHQAGRTGGTVRRRRSRPAAACAPGPGSSSRASTLATCVKTRPSPIRLTAGADSVLRPRGRRSRRPGCGPARPGRADAPSASLNSAGATLGSGLHALGPPLRAVAVRRARCARRGPTRWRRIRVASVAISAATRIVEQGDEREHHGGPHVVGHAVEVADLEEAARPHRREQRGEVIVEVGLGRAATVEQRSCRRPSRRTAPSRSPGPPRASCTSITGARSA